MIKNQKGSALILTMMVMLFIAILGMSFVTMSTNDGLQAIRHEQKTQAHYNARSGIYMAGRWLEGWLDKEAEGLDNFSGVKLSGSISDFKEVSEFKDDDISVEIEKIDDNTVNIRSTGRDKGQSYFIAVREVSIRGGVNNTSQLPSEIGSINKAMFTLGGGNPTIEIQMASQAEINGPIGTNLVGNKNDYKDTIIFNGSDSNEGLDSFKKIKENSSSLFELRLPFGSGSNQGSESSIIDQSIKGHNKKEKVIEDFGIKDLLDEELLGKSISSNDRNSSGHRDTFIKSIYPEVKILSFSEADSSEFQKIKMNNKELNDLSHSNLSSGDVEDSGSTRVFKEKVYIDASKSGLDIKDKNTIFEGDFYIDAGNKDVNIKNTVFKGNVYIKGGSEVRFHSLKETETIIEGNLYVNGSGDLVLTNNSEENLFKVGGLVYAPNRKFDSASSNVEIGHAIVASSVRFQKKLKIDFKPLNPSTGAGTSNNNESSESSGEPGKVGNIIEQIDSSKWDNK